MAFDLYETITKEIMHMLEKGVVPWRSPILGRSRTGHPKNLESRKPYRGVNVFLLAFTAYARGYGSSYWATFDQAKEHGGTVRKGEKSTMVVFFKQYETEDRQTGEAKTVPIMRYYRLFNLAQCDGITAPDAVPYTPLDFQPIAEAEKLVNGYQDGPEVIHGGGSAHYYRPSTDTVHLPEPSRFINAEEYYSVRLHELAHSSGHSKRLNRGIDTDTAPFGSANYGREELIAEMAAAFLTARCGINPPVIEQQAAYLAGWLKVLKGDKRLVISAASAAQKAADWIRGERGQAAL